MKNTKSCVHSAALHRMVLVVVALIVCAAASAASAVPAGTTIFFDNTNSRWSEIYISFTAESNVGKDISQYSPKSDKWFGLMTLYEGDIYSFTTTEECSTGYFSFWSKNIYNYEQVWQVDVLPHYEFYSDKPCFRLTYSEYNTNRQSNRWHADAIPFAVLNISASRSNPITQGDDIYLYASNYRGTCTWYYSYDEVTWTVFTGTTIGTYNETIAPTPIVGTFYKASDGYTSAIYQVQVIIKCTGNSQTHLEEHFSSPALASFTARRRDKNVPSSYVFSAEGKEVHDGFYAVVANPLFCGRGNRTTPSWCHAEDCIGNVNADGSYWYVDRTDHTGDANGGMLFLNCNNKGEVMYSCTRSVSCTNIYMTFSAWFANAAANSGGINTRFVVRDKNGNEITSARMDVVDIKKEDGWIQGQTAFFSGDNDQLTVEIINNGTSGIGNDILIDDITFTSCIPKLEIRPAIDVKCGDDALLTVESEGIEQIFSTLPYYLWQVLDENDTDPATQWHDIADDPVAGRESHGGSGIDKVQYEVEKTKYSESQPKYRVIMAADAAMAKQVGHNIFPVCQIYAETEIAIVECECAPQTIALKSGDDAQDVCGGENIGTVTYKASGEKTNSIGVDGLPSSLTTTISGTELTISGKAPDVDDVTDYTAKIYAKGVEGIACKSDTLMLNLHVRPTPDAPNVEF